MNDYQNHTLRQFTHRQHPASAPYQQKGSVHSQARQHSQQQQSPRLNTNVQGLIFRQAQQILSQLNLQQLNPEQAARRHTGSDKSPVNPVPVKPFEKHSSGTRYDRHPFNPKPFKHRMPEPHANTHQNRFRSIDGSGNNRKNPEWGATHQPLTRSLIPDASREPGGAAEAGLPSARAVSNAVSAQSENTANRKGLSDMFWLWGQFLDHDITLVEGREGNEKANIAVPKGDPQFDPQGTGNKTLDFTRSDSFTDAMGQKRHINEISAFIDGSNVYGSDEETANSLRSFEGGRMRVSEGNLLPRDAEGNFLAGDVRANENAGLTSMHTLWVREHNRIADQISERRPGLSDEKVYQQARRQVVAQMQAITYNEFLPNLLGEGAIEPYRGYDPKQNPQMSQAFSSSAYRFGHTMLSSNLLRLDENGQEIPEGNLSLREAFFQPQRVSEAGIDPILRGFASQTAQAVDPMIVDDVRNFLFGPPGAGGLDLASLNIQRGRDHGLPGYNDARAQMGMARIESFDDPIWKDGVGAKLAQVYDSPDDVDLWVAGLAEKHTGDSLLGETNTRILSDQFTALRDGDRFWYENQYSGKRLQRLNQLSLSDVIKRNSDVENIQDNSMVASNVHLDTPVKPAADAPTAVSGFAQSARGVTAPTATAQVGATGDQQGQPLDARVVRDLQEAISRGRLNF